MIAFRMSLVSFFIPFAFAFDQALLGVGSPLQIASAFLTLLAGTGTWTLALTGYLGGRLNIIERLLFGAVAIIVIFSPTGHLVWGIGCAGILALLIWCLLLRARFLTQLRAGDRT
jgi:TRAP-type uncharacterized transport system fused permease subunit